MYKRTRDTLSANRSAAIAVLVAGAAVVATFALLVATAEPVGPFFAAVVATFAGVLAGVPVGLSLSDRDRALARRAEDDQRGIRRARLLRLIRDDLADTIVELDRPIRQPRVQAVVPFLGSGMWETLKASGDLGLVDDPTMLREVSRAYRRVGVTALLEESLMGLTFDPMASMATDPPQTLWENGLRLLTNQDVPTRAAMKHARALLNRAIGEPDPG